MSLSVAKFMPRSNSLDWFHEDNNSILFTPLFYDQVLLLISSRIAQLFKKTIIQWLNRINICFLVLLSKHWSFSFLNVNKRSWIISSLNFITWRLITSNCCTQSYLIATHVIVVPTFHWSSHGLRIVRYFVSCNCI